MNDAVSQELERRASLALPWRWAVLGALAIHLAVLAALLLAPSHPRRALRLPHVQVRLGALPVPAAAAPRAVAPSRPPAPVPTARVDSQKRAEPPPRHPLPPKRAAKEPPAAEPAPPAAPGASAGRAAASGAGGIALGVGSGAGDESFPFSYYLNRVLALIQGNWFRPPAPPETRCTVRCIIDRSGRLVDAGLEQESPFAAFDRAALRAVYAAAPFPPLPDGFGGETLTLHLEFGQ